MEGRDDCCTLTVVALAAATAVVTALSVQYLSSSLERFWAEWTATARGSRGVSHTQANGASEKPSMWTRVHMQGASMEEDEANGATAIVSGFVRRSILQWRCLEDSLAEVLAQKAATEVTPVDQWREVIREVLHQGLTEDGKRVIECATIDLQVIMERDPACPGPAHALLFFKGYQGLQLHRVAHVLWRQGKMTLASLIQSRASEAFGMDIHPAARIGVGVMFDHGTGIVIGETAVVGDGCTLLHGVTLGGTGKDKGDRHPKVGAHVLIGAGASVLGRCRIGEGAKIGAAALVLTDIPPHATAVGCPAKVVGRSKEEDPASRMDQGCQSVFFFKGHSLALCPFRKLGGGKGYLGPHEMQARLEDMGVHIPPGDIHALFFELDADNDGMVSEKEFEDGFVKFKDTLGRFGHSLATLGCPEDVPKKHA